MKKFLSALIIQIISISSFAVTIPVNTSTDRDMYGNCYTFVVDGASSYAIIDINVNSTYVQNVVIPDSIIYGKATLPVTIITDWAYYYGKNIKKLTVGSNIILCKRDCFGGLTNLNEIIFNYGPETLEFSTDYQDNPNYGDPLFHEVPLKTLSIDRNWTVPSVYYMQQFSTRPPFMNNTTLEKVTIGDHVTTLHALEFSGCKKLKEITLGKSLSSIDKDAFYYCEAIEKVTVNAEIPPTFNETNPFYSTVYLTAQLVVPQGTRELYQQSLGWNNFLDIVEMEAGVNDVRVDNNEICVTIDGGTIHIDGVADGTTIEIYDISGRLIRSSICAEIHGLQSGLYIVRAGNKSTKVKI